MIAALVIPITIVLVGRLESLDLGYVVRAGQVMLESGDLLRTDQFLFTTRCGPWLNQQWGAELLLAGGFQGLGWLGLALIRAALTGAAMAFVFATCRAYGATRRSAAWLTLLAGGLALGGFQLRAQLFGVVFFSASMWLLALRREHPNLVFVAASVLFLWANVHGSFPFGILLLLFAWAEDRLASRPTERRTLAAALLAAGATLMTPFGPSVWSYVADLSTNPAVRSVVEEWRPPGFPSLSGAVLYASFAIALLVLLRNRGSLPWPALVELGLFALFAATSARAIVWWALVVPVALARLPWAHRDVAADPRNRLNWGLAATLAAIPLFALGRWLPYSGDEPPPNLVTNAPQQLTAELRSILEPGEPFKNPQVWGSWFELSLPGHPVFVDSRFEVMPSESLRVNHRIATVKPGWENTLNALPLRVLVVNADRESALVEALGTSTEWRRVYADEDGLIYLREGRPPAEPLPPCGP